MIGKEVSLKVGGQTYQLVPTLDAMRKINRRHDSIVSAMERVRVLDFDAVCAVVAAGAGLSQKQAERLESEIFEAGLVNATGPVAEFLGLLLDPTGKGDSAEGDDAGEA